MKIRKFLTVGFLASCVSLTHAAPSEDFMTTNPACMVELSDITTARFVNVNYIRLIKMKKSTSTIEISLASTYGQSDSNSEINLKYPSNAEAMKGINIIYDRINDCRYNADLKRINSKKVK